MMRVMFVVLAVLACSASADVSRLQELRSKAQASGLFPKANFATRHIETSPDFIPNPQGENLTEKLFITEPGLYMDPTPYGHRYQRKEVREMTGRQWGQYADALWKMKLMDYADLVKEYGTDARPYDFFPAKHTWALLHHPCPTPAYSSVFLNFHRAMILEFERAMRAVCEGDFGLPYWDMALDGTNNPGEVNPISAVFSDKYFGGEGVAPDYVVKDGSFANFPIYQKPGGFIEMDNMDLRNGHGMLRADFNLNPAPFLTRRFQWGPITVEDNEEFTIPNKEREQVIVTQLSINKIQGTFGRINVGIHPFGHGFRGGAWGQDNPTMPDVVGATKYVPTMLQHHCYECPAPGACAEGGLSEEECVCRYPLDYDSRIECLTFMMEHFFVKEIDPESGHWLTSNSDPLNVNWLLFPYATAVPGHNAVDLPYFGDLSDPGSSPNDPIFWSLHSNVERLYHTWQSRFFQGFIERDEAVPNVFSDYNVDGGCFGRGLFEPVSLAYFFTNAKLMEVTLPIIPEVDQSGTDWYTSHINTTTVPSGPLYRADFYYVTPQMDGSLEYVGITKEEYEGIQDGSIKQEPVPPQTLKPLTEKDINQVLDTIWN